jgi:hypothetical protein
MPEVLVLVCLPIGEAYGVRHSLSAKLASWRALFACPPGSGRPGGFLGPKLPEGGQRWKCQYVPKGGNGKLTNPEPYWKTQGPGQKGWDRFTNSGEPMTANEAHPSNDGGEAAPEEAAEASEAGTEAAEVAAEAAGAEGAAADTSAIVELLILLEEL